MTDTKRWDVSTASFLQPVQRDSVDVIEDLNIRGPREFPVKVLINDVQVQASRARQWHWHQEMQLCLVIRGAVTFRVGLQQYDLQTGDGIFINHKCPHKALSQGSQQGTFICIDLNEKLWRSFPGSVIETRYFNPYICDSILEALKFRQDVPWQRDVLDSITGIWQLMITKTFGYEIQCVMHLYQILYQIVTHCPPEPGHPHKTEQLRTIISYIHEHFSEKITLEAIAGQVHVSTSECCRIFKQALGNTIFDYILECRIDQSLEKLTLTEEPISSIAYDCGFSSASYFSKEFRKRMKITPGLYRKQSRSHEEKIF